MGVQHGSLKTIITWGGREGESVRLIKRNSIDSCSFLVHRVYSQLKMLPYLLLRLTLSSRRKRPPRVVREKTVRRNYFSG